MEQDDKFKFTENLKRSRFVLKNPSLYIPLIQQNAVSRRSEPDAATAEMYSLKPEKRVLQNHPQSND